MSKSPKRDKKRDKDNASPQPAVKATPEPPVVKVYHKEFGMSFTTPDLGFNMMPEGFQMCEEIFSLLMDRFDNALMKKRVDREYKQYSTNNAIQNAMNAINIS